MILSIEGIIGAGKSTLARDLALYLGYEYAPEPFDQGLLELYYSDPVRWAFAFQVEMAVRRHAIHRRATWAVRSGSANGVVIDRSIWGDRAFALLNWKHGNMSDVERTAYDRLFETLTTDIAPLDKVILLRVDPETALKRVEDRARGGETKISLSYQRGLSQYVDEMCGSMCNGFYDPFENPTGGVFEVDWSKFREASDVWSKMG